jgi:hypothetical protein
MLLGSAISMDAQAQLSPLTPTYNASCAFNGCHGANLPPAGARINAANAPAVLPDANAAWNMGIGGLSAGTLATIAAELNTFFATQLAPQAVNVNYLSRPIIRSPLPVWCAMGLTASFRQRPKLSHRPTAASR